MIDLGISKLALIGAVALIVIGPEKLPRVARTVGTLLGKAQRYVNDVKAEVNRSMELDELRKMKDTVHDAARDVEQTIQTGASDFEKQSWAEAARTPLRIWPSSESDRFLNTGIRARTGGSSKGPRRSGTRRATASVPKRCQAPRAWRASGRTRSTSRNAGVARASARSTSFDRSVNPWPTSRIRTKKTTNSPAPSSHSFST